MGGVLLDRCPDGRAGVVLIRRGRPPNEGGWSLPGGRVERGETLADALKREMREETGLDVEVGELLLVAELIEADFHYVVLDYACVRAGGVLAASDDAAEAELVPIEDVPARGATALVIEVIDRARARALERDRRAPT